MNNFPQIYQSLKHENCQGGWLDGTGESRNMWCNRELKLGFADGTKLTCKHVSLACVIRVNTAKLPLLKQQEKEALFVRIKDGDIEAREEFIKGNLRLVLSVIKRFSSSNENVDDLFQIGCIGLMKAIDNFDITLNVKFSTYAVPTAYRWGNL